MGAIARCHASSAVLLPGHGRVNRRSSYEPTGPAGGGNRSQAELRTVSHHDWTGGFLSSASCDSSGLIELGSSDTRWSLASRTPRGEPRGAARRLRLRSIFSAGVVSRLLSKIES